LGLLGTNRSHSNRESRNARATTTRACPSPIRGSPLTERFYEKQKIIITKLKELLKEARLRLLYLKDTLENRVERVAGLVVIKHIIDK